MKTYTEQHLDTYNHVHEVGFLYSSDAAERALELYIELVMDSETPGYIGNRDTWIQDWHAAVQADSYDQEWTDGQPWLLCDRTPEQSYSEVYTAALDGCPMDENTRKWLDTAWAVKRRMDTYVQEVLDDGTPCTMTLDEWIGDFRTYNQLMCELGQ